VVELRGGLEGNRVTQGLQLPDQVGLVPVGVAAADKPVTTEVVVIAAVGQQVPGDHQDRVADGAAAFFLPMRRASRQNWAARYQGES
jgi:hypothetical protein